MKPVAEAKPAAAGLRTWSDATGKFRLEAELVGVEDGKAILKKKDGEQVLVPIDKLSKEDQELLEKK